MRSKTFLSRINTQHMRNSTFVYPVKMEYVSRINMFSLKMMVKSGLEKNILKFLHAQFFFYFKKMLKNANSVKKRPFLSMEGFQKKLLRCMYI
jgi:hypothetical protein